MNEEKTFVAENEVAENVETTTEETPKTYTEAEFNAKLDEVLGKKIARKEAKIRKEYERKYGGLTEVLTAGTGEEDVDKMTDTFREFYERKGIKMPTKPQYTDKDIAVLAKAEADEIIRGGFEDVVEEADRLNDLGVENMTAREKAVFIALTDHIKNTETSRELSQIGVTEDVYGSKEFKDFADQFKPGKPIKEIYDLFVKNQPKKEIKTAGSMKNPNGASGAIKEYYTPEEAKRFPQEEINKNPALRDAIVRSMAKWGK